MNASPSSNMSSQPVCWNCGEIILGSFKFCPFCGKEVARKCPNCGHVIPAQYAYCPECGADNELFQEQFQAHAAKYPAGTKGVYNGREAIRIDLNGKKYVVATTNEGAKNETDYGDHFTFDEALEKFSAGKEGYDAEGVWRLPTLDELVSFASLANLWITRSGVNGRSFTVAEGKTLFLPAAGDFWDNDGALYAQGKGGRYRSSTLDDSGGAHSLNFGSDYLNRCVWRLRIDGLSVRLFCALPSE